MYGKIQILGKLELVTGTHIGGSSAFAAIGAVDSPIIKDIRTNLPMIPGSSLKGKMRSLLAKVYNEKPVAKPDDDNERITRLFGSAKEKNVKTSRIIISDMRLSNEEELRNAGLESMTEIKFENTINRITAVANPRQLERAVRGSKFDVDFIYEVYEKSEEQDIIMEIKEDIDTLVMGMKLLQFDYLGGSGSRGYGQVKFIDMYAETAIGDIPEEIIAVFNERLKEV